MRILNLVALKVDVDNMFDISFHEHDKKIRDWFKSSWTKVLVKDKWFQDKFVHRVLPVGTAGNSKFRGFGAKTTLGLYTRVGTKKIDLSEFTEFDHKDAVAGTLFWYSPTTHSLNHYNHMTDIMFVRDYLRSLVEENPLIDLRRINADDAKKAATKWHAEAAKRLAEAHAKELEAKRAELEKMSEAERRAFLEKSTTALRAWRTLQSNTDWVSVSEFHHSGTAYELIRLTSPKALKVESEAMSHCVYSYVKELYNERTTLLSVRLKESVWLPRVTIELHSPPLHVIQIQGPDNTRIEKSLEHAIEQECLKESNALMYVRLTPGLTFSV